MSFVCPNCGYKGIASESDNQYTCNWCYESITKENYKKMQEKIVKYTESMFSSKNNSIEVLETLNRIDQYISNLPTHEKASKEYIEQLERQLNAPLTPELIVEKAKDVEDFVPAAALIRRKIEKKWKEDLSKIEYCTVENVGSKDFWIEISKFNKIYNENFKCESKNAPRLMYHPEKNNFVEIPTYIRMYLLGIEDVDMARTLANDYYKLNCFIHYSEENIENINKNFFGDSGVERGKIKFKEMIKRFREYGVIEND